MTCPLNQTSSILFEDADLSLGFRKSLSTIAEQVQATPQPQQPSHRITPAHVKPTNTMPPGRDLPPTIVSKSAHPDDAAKIMDEPLPYSPLTAKKIPSKKDSGENQAEPYTVKTYESNWFNKMKFW